MSRDRAPKSNARTTPRVLLFATSALIASANASADWPSAQRDPSQRLEGATAARRAEMLSELAARNPSAAEPLVVRSLEDPDDTVRATAAELAARLRIRAAKDALVRWLDDGQPALRAAAARALGTLGDRATIPAIARLFNDRDSEVKLAAVQAIGAIGGDAAVVPLLDRLSDDESEIRVAAARALGELGDARAVLSLLGVLQDPTPEVREAVSVALGRLRDERALRGLVALLRDAQPEVRLAAARAIGLVGATNAVVDLAPIALGADYITDISQRTELARAAITAIGRIGGPAALELLVRVFRTSVSQDVARAAADALRAMGERARESIPTLAAEPVPMTAREPLATLLGDLGGDEGANALLGLSDASRPPSAESYARALGRTGSSRALYALLRTATEREANTTRQTSFGAIATATPARRAAALRGIEAWAQRRGELEPGALDPLLVILREVQRAPSTPQPARAVAAAPTQPELLLVIRLIGSTRNPRAPSSLLSLLTATDRTVRVAVTEALTRVGVAGIERAVVAALTDSTAAVRSNAADALGRFGAQPALDALLSAWSGDRPIDRAAAATAIGRISARVRDLRAAPLFIAQLEDARPAVASAMIDALGCFASIGSEPARATLERLVDARAANSNAAIEALANAANSAPSEHRATLVRSLHERDGDRFNESIRATATWGMGAATDEAAINWLATSAREASNAVAANALGGLARAIRAGAVATDAVRQAACDSLARRANPAVRANALSVLAASRHRCDGDPTRRMLFDARSPWVRRAAATALWASSVDAAAQRSARDALARCATTDRAPSVATFCASVENPPRITRDPEPIDVLVLGEDEDAPAASTSYVLVRPDGLLRYGTTGNTGWLHDRPSTPGEYVLIDPTQLANEP
ncbi:MAG: HEAT repeat domain-containing protein [Polyangiales bacterium]